ncbi:MAG: hypothetical protein QXF52_07150 [Thermoproteota archaeon]
MRQSAEDFAPVLGIIASFTSLLVISIMALNPPAVGNDFPFRKTLAGILFNAICLAGILASLFPKCCSRIFFKEEAKKDSLQLRIKGHHPDCEAFSTHVIKIRGHTICAACTGLFLGGFSAILFSTAYFFGGLSFGNSFQLILLGALGVMLVFLGQVAKGFTRVLLNFFFPIGGMLVLIGVDKLFEDMFLDVFLNALIVFWIFTRIMVSSWGHSKTCSKCKSPCTGRDGEN